jgi:outer membrane lipoprotein
MKRLLLASALAALLLSGCAHAISGGLRGQARTDVPFREVAGSPSFYKGYLFIWGGTIVRTTAAERWSEVEVVENPLDRYGAVKNEDVSGGRFLVRSERFLDPLIFEKGRKVTVAGVLVGSVNRRIDDASYTYPVLEPREIHLWREEEYYDRPYHYPYYHPWYYDPWWDRWPYRRHGPWCDPFWDPWCP